MSDPLQQISATSSQPTSGTQGAGGGQKHSPADKAAFQQLKAMGQVAQFQQAKQQSPGLTASQYLQQIQSQQGGTQSASAAGASGGSPTGAAQSMLASALGPTQSVSA